PTHRAPAHLYTLSLHDALPIFFSTKSTSTVSRITTIRIDDNLTASESNIALWSTNHKPTRWINKILRVLIQQESWHNSSNDIFHHIFFNLIIRTSLMMLSRQDDCIYSNWVFIFIVFNCNLRLSIRT